MRERLYKDDDILTAHPESRSFGVAPVHGIIKLSIDGALIIEPASRNELLVVYPTSGERISLLAGASHVLQDSMSLQFSASHDLIYQACFNSDNSVKNYAAYRNFELQTRGMTVPD